MNLMFFSTIFFLTLTTWGQTPIFDETLNEKIVGAAKNGKVKELHELLQKKGNPDAKDKGGLPAIFYASGLKDPGCVKELAAGGGDLNIKIGGLGLTPLLNATLHERDKLVVFFISKKIDVNQTSVEGDTALHIAASKGNKKILNILIKANAKIDAVNNRNETPLMLAAREGKTETIKELLKAGANTSIESKVGKTALDMARESGHSDAVQAFVKFKTKKKK
jgi:ankyrin repeat protein